MVLFRPEGNLAIEFSSAFVSVAVIYICLLPIEYLMRPTPAEDSTLTESRQDKPIFSLLMSALFIAFLFVLYLFALLQDALLT
jgi:hypothetical protein